MIQSNVMMQLMISILCMNLPIIKDLSISFVRVAFWFRSSSLSQL